jgi:hypothetical protein
MLNESEKLIIFANAFILLSLIPSIISIDKPHWTTSLMNFGLTFFYLRAYYGLNFRVLLLVNSLIGLCWLLLFFQKITG